LRHVPHGCDRDAAAGEDEDADERVDEDKGDDGVGPLAEAALWVQAEVEEEDGSFDEPDAEGEDVFCGEIVLSLSVGVCSVWSNRARYLFERLEFDEVQVPYVHAVAVLDVYLVTFIHYD
jgi:hypothetical protein